MAKLGKKRQLSGDERDDSEPEVKQKKAKTDKRAKETSKSSSSEEPFWQVSLRLSTGSLQQANAQPVKFSCPRTAACPSTNSTKACW